MCIFVDHGNQKTDIILPERFSAKALIGLSHVIAATAHYPKRVCVWW